MVQKGTDSKDAFMHIKDLAQRRCYQSAVATNSSSGTPPTIAAEPTQLWESITQLLAGPPAAVGSVLFMGPHSSVMAARTQSLFASHGRRSTISEMHARKKQGRSPERRLCSSA